MCTFFISISFLSFEVHELDLGADLLGQVVTLLTSGEAAPSFASRWGQAWGMVMLQGSLWISLEPSRLLLEPSLCRFFPSFCSPLSLSVFF